MAILYVYVITALVIWGGVSTTVTICLGGRAVTRCDIILTVRLLNDCITVSNKKHSGEFEPRRGAI